MYDQKRDDYYNSVLALGECRTCYQRGQAIATRRAFAPVGDYVPWGCLREVAPFFNLPKSFKPGERGQPQLVLGQQLAAPAIVTKLHCRQLRKRMSEQTTLIVTVSNDTWFGRLSVLAACTDCCMRALEFARPVLRAANTGIAQIMDARDKLLRSYPLLKPVS